MITLYVTSMQLKVLSENEIVLFERQSKIKFPQQYCNFMNTYGIGTYSGAICISTPDFNILKDFSDYDFWQHKNAPITKEQIKECIVIGNSIDGDFIAAHSNLDGYILLPRHSETITLVPYNDEKFIDTIIKIGHCFCNEDLENYFEPLGGNHIFLHYINKDLHDIVNLFRSTFRNDFLIENEYICEVFLTQMDGYVRFNLAYGFEVSIFYSDYGVECFRKVEKFLLDIQRHVLLYIKRLQ